MLLNHNDYQAVQCKKIKIIIEARAESSHQQRVGASQREAKGIIVKNNEIKLLVKLCILIHLKE